MSKKFESKTIRLINDRRSLKENTKEDYSTEISYWENVLLDLERHGDWDSDEHEEAQSRLNHYRNLQYGDNFYVEYYSSGNGLSASANEIYNYIKNVYGFKNITADSVSPLIACRVLIKDAVNQYIIDYGVPSQTIEDYMNKTEFELIAHKLVGDLMEDSTIEESYDWYDGWEPEDIELHKSINWSKNNYKPQVVYKHAFRGIATLYQYDKEPIKVETEFAKYLDPNPISDPYFFAPIESGKELFGIPCVGPMYDGNTQSGLAIFDRFETQEVYNLLSENVINKNRPPKPKSLKEYVDYYGNWSYEDGTKEEDKTDFDRLAHAILSTGYKPKTSIENLCYMIAICDPIYDGKEGWDWSNINNILDYVSENGGFSEFDYEV